MPWRKYYPEEGKYGPNYHIATGVKVRCDARGKWTLFIEQNGTRTSRTIGKGRGALVKAIKAGEQIATQLIKAKADNANGEPKPVVPSFKEFSHQWFVGNSRRWDQFTSQRYEEILRLHIWPSDVFDKLVDKVSRQEIKQHLRSVFRKRSSATVEAVHSVISGVFEEAIDDGMLGANPARGLLKKILPPKRQRDEKDPAPFTREELQRFLNISEQICTRTEQLILKVMAYAGLRLGEALALRVKNLDFDKMAYHVNESYKLKRFKKPKFGKTRILDLPSYLVAELKDYVRYLQKENLKQGRGGGVDLLFIDPTERGLWPYSQRKVQGLMKKVCKASGLAFRNPHDLRHTYATLLLMAHQSPGYVQKQLGHSSISITMDIYCHWIPGEGREGLEEALGGQKFVPNRGEKRIFPHILKNDLSN
jgi:integrase